MKKLLLAFIFLSAVHKINAQEWAVYNTLTSDIPSDVVNGVAISGIGDVCVATDGGSGRFDAADLTTYYPHSLLGAEFYMVQMVATEGSTTVWYDAMGHMGAPHGLISYDGTDYSHFQYYNSGLPYDYVNSIAIAGNGTKWIGTRSMGLVEYDEVNWTIYDQSNSGILSDYITTIKIDANGIKWIGTKNAGLARFDGENFIDYSPWNSSMPNAHVRAIDIDCYGAKWIGTESGLVKLDDNNITVYNTSNSDLPDNTVYSIAIDSNNNKWIGTDAGLAEFDGVNWTIYNIENSDLPSDYIKSVAIDENDVKWIGTLDSGLASFTGGSGGVGCISMVDTNDLLNEDVILYPISPNPVSHYTVFSFYLPNLSNVSLYVFDMQGKLVANPVNRERLEGKVAINFNVSNLSAGIYFYQIQTDDVIKTKKMVIAEK